MMPTNICCLCECDRGKHVLRHLIWPFHMLLTLETSSEIENKNWVKERLYNGMTDKARQKQA